MRKQWELMRMTGLVCVAVGLLSGCGTASYKFATGPTAKANYGIEIYATDNVPFEYTELGIVRGEAEWAFAWPDEQMYMEGVIKEAKALNADAVINFHLNRHSNSSGFILVVGKCLVDAEGVAVKIKRP